MAFASQQTLEPEETDLQKFLFETKGLISISIGEKISIDIETSSDLWLCNVDQAQLKNAILNLATNSRDAMPIGGQVTIGAQNIAVGTMLADSLDLTPGNYVSLSLTDTGSGISEDELAHVFEPFFTGKGRGGSSGLGLSMVYGFTRQSGGCIDIETNEGRGTTVRLYFPASGSAQQIVGDKIGPGQAECGGPKKKILLVEDNRAFRNITSKILKNLNFEVSDYDTAEEAIATLGGATKFDLLLSDIMLPGKMNGDDLAEKAIVAQPDLKVVLMSANSDLLTTNGSSDGNIAAYLRKPHRRAELVQTLYRVLETQS